MRTPVLTVRAATAADLAALVALYRACDVAAFGNPEHDEDEVAEEFDGAAGVLLAEDGDRLAGAAMWTSSEASLLADPADPAPAQAALVEALAEHGVDEVEAYDGDLTLRDALEQRGWRHLRSAFELIRAVSDDWTLAEPAWPDGVDVRPLRDEDAEAIHHLIYAEAGWADVPGHGDRDFAEWRTIFLPPDVTPDHHILAWREDRLVGVEIGRTWSDGTGWVSQLAVATDQRGLGLGRALLLEALRRRVEAGVERLGLSVQAENRDALRMYLDVGLVVDREWMTYRRGAGT